MFFLFFTCVCTYICEAKKKYFFPRSKYYISTLYILAYNVLCEYICATFAYTCHERERERVREREKREKLYTHVHVSYTILRDNPSVHCRLFHAKYRSSSLIDQCYVNIQL